MTIKRNPNIAERIAQAINRALDEQGCSYCRKFKPADQVRTVRNRLSGRRMFICDACDERRRASKAKP